MAQEQVQHTTSQYVSSARSAIARYLLYRFMSAASSCPVAYPSLTALDRTCSTWLRR